MKKITKIDELPQGQLPNTNLRVAAYARVSTDSDEQLESLKAQREHYERYIKSNPEWVFAGLYYEMKTLKVIQFENTNPTQKARNKGI